MQLQVALQFDFFMKIQIFLRVFVIGNIVVNNAYAQNGVYPQEDPSLVDVSLQLQLRNSEGQLVTYTEPTTMFIANINKVHEYLDTKENKKIIEKDGGMFELVQYQQVFRMTETKQIATVGMWYEEDFVLMFRHDAFVTAPGDTINAFWNIVRTIQ